MRTGILGANNPNIRPEATTAVSIELTVASLELDPSEETLTVHGKLTVIWPDYFLWDHSGYELEILHAKEGEVWRPELVVENAVEDTAVIIDENMMYRIHYTGIVTWEPALNIKVHCPHDLTYFPFDKQTCGITLSSWSYDHSETPLQPLSDKVNFNMYKASSDFQLEESRVETSEVMESQGTLTRTYSKLTFYITVQRHSQFYGLTIILPLVLLSALTSVTFVLPTETGEKANYSVTILLMIIVFYTVAFGYIPVFTGFSLLVVYAGVVLILATLAFLCNLFVLYVYHLDKHREMRAVVRSVLHILTLITCTNRASDDSKSVVMSEETTSSRLSEHDIQACSSLPNGGLGDRKPGRLSPINRRVVPSDTLIENETVSNERLKHQGPVPPLTQATHPDTHNHADLMRVEHLQTFKRNPVKEHLNVRSPWQELSVCLDRLFFVTFVVVSFIIHLAFLSVLGTGSV